MLSKEQEKVVLQTIKRQIEKAGEGSYIAMAFEGCVKDAEENIENDFGLSWYGRAQSAEKKAEQAEAKAAKAEAAAAAEKERADAAETENRRLKQYIEYWQDETKQAGKEAADARKEADEARKEAEALRQQVIELKARLYDFIVKG